MIEDCPWRYRLAKSLRNKRELLLNWFRAEGGLSSGDLGQQVLRECLTQFTPWMQPT